jgi:hypothetical protein
VYGDSVTMSWGSTGASGYDVKIYFWDGSDWLSYYTYTTSSTSKTFWPTRETEYAFLVRSRSSSGTTSEWSAASYFSFEG